MQIAITVLIHISTHSRQVVAMPGQVVASISGSVAVGFEVVTH